MATADPTSPLIVTLVNRPGGQRTDLAPRIRPDRLPVGAVNYERQRTHIGSLHRSCLEYKKHKNYATTEVTHGCSFR